MKLISFTSCPELMQMRMKKKKYSFLQYFILITITVIAWLENHFRIFNHIRVRNSDINKVT